MRTWSFLCVRRIHTGVEHTDNESSQHFWLGNLFSCAPDADRVRTLGLWISGSTLYQLTGWRNCSIGIALNSRSKDPGVQTRPGREHKKHVWELFFRFKNAVLTRCRWVWCAQPPRVYTHANKWTHTHIKDTVVHVRVRWITETGKDPACTCRTG